MLPLHSTPVTPTFTTRGIRIDLPAAPIHHTPTTLPEQPQLQIHYQLITPITRWESILWANIQVQTQIPDLYQYINMGQQIIVSSNATMNPNCDSSFAWLIAMHQPLWQGEGAVPGPIKDAHTRQSEAYILLTALKFLVHYIQHFLMIYHLTRTMLAFCDNSGTISRIESLLQEKPTLTHSMILDNYDVYTEIAQTTWCLHLLRVHYLHIKGHQDKNQPVHTLMKPAQYNVNCDHWAATTLPNLTQFSTNCPTYPMPRSYPHLVIDCKVVVRDLQGALWHAAVTPAYWSCLQTTFQWTTTNAEEVNWNALTMTLKHFPKDHSLISKVIHEWLPLLGAHSTEILNTMLCPQCQQAHKDNWHFLKCMAPTWQTHFNQLHRDLQQLHNKHKIDPHLFQLLCQGLLSIQMTTDINEQLADYPPQYQALFKRQKEIGWEQLYYGCIAVSWVHYIDSTTKGKQAEWSSTLEP